MRNITLEAAGSRDARDVSATTGILAAVCVEVIVLPLDKLDMAFPGGKLMLATIAERERDLRAERALAGLARAFVEGRTLGRPTGQKARAAYVAIHKAGGTFS